jgi:hypothetical protein
MNTRMFVLLCGMTMAIAAVPFAARGGSDDAAPLVDQPIGHQWWDATTLDVASIEPDIKLENDAVTHARGELRQRVITVSDHATNKRRAAPLP